MNWPFWREGMSWLTRRACWSKVAPSTLSMCLTGWKSRDIFNPRKRQHIRNLMLTIARTSLVQSFLASTYRSAVGTLLYIASDYPECQFTIRALATWWPNPQFMRLLAWSILLVICLDVPTNVCSWPSGHSMGCTTSMVTLWCLKFSVIVIGLRTKLKEEC